MRKLFLVAIVVMLSAGVFMLRTAAHQDSFREPHNSAVEADGAFRDGSYQGWLAARRGEEPHISEGRWSNQAERASFTAGYQQGYDEAVAVRAAVVDRTH